MNTSTFKKLYISSIISFLIILSTGILAQNVGIGTDNPQSKLHVYGGNIQIEDSFPYLILNDTAAGGSIGGFAFQHNDAFQGFLMYNFINSYFKLSNEPVGFRNDLIINSIGNIGMGTASPEYKLDVYGGDIQIKDSYPYLIFNDTATGGGITGLAFAYNDGFRGFFNYNMNENYFKFSNTEFGDRNDLTISENGFIGIGTFDPDYQVHLVGSDTLASVLIAPNASSNYNSELILAEDDDYTFGMKFIYDGLDNQLKVFGKSSSSNYGPHVNINRDNGRVGIGVESPTEKLDVLGDIKASGTLISNSLSAGSITCTGSVTTGSIDATGSISATGSIDAGGDLLSGDDVWVNSSSPFLFVDATGTSGIEGIGFREQGSSRGWIYYDVGSDFLTLNTDPGDGTRRDLVIDSDGEIGIGLSNPSEKMHISGGDLRIDDTYPSMILNATTSSLASEISFRLSGSEKAQIYYGNTSEILYLSADPTGTLRNDITITPDGNVGFGTNNPNTNLHIYHATGAFDHGLTFQNSYDSDMWNYYMYTSNDLTLWFNDVEKGAFDDVTGNYTASSDLRLKKNIEPIEPVLSKVLELNPRRYHFNIQEDSGQKHLGFIAQDVLDVFPSLVHYQDEADLYTLDYSGFGVLAIKAIQEQQEIINDQQQRIDELMQRIEKLENK